jgi:hypothetical protein
VPLNDAAISALKTVLKSGRRKRARLYICKNGRAFETAVTGLMTRYKEFRGVAQW